VNLGVVSEVYIILYEWIIVTVAMGFMYIDH